MQLGMQLGMQKRVLFYRFKGLMVQKNAFLYIFLPIQVAKGHFVKK